MDPLEDGRDNSMWTLWSVEKASKSKAECGVEKPVERRKEQVMQSRKLVSRHKKPDKAA